MGIPSRKNRTRLALGWVLALAAAFRPADAAADQFFAPRSLAVEILSESVTTAFAPTPFTVEDFALEWEGPAPAAVRVSLVPGSLQWGRISNLIVLPRARLAVAVDASEGGEGSVATAGYFQPLHEGRAELPVALLAGPENLVELSVGGRVHRLRIRLKPRDPSLARPVIDSSCSRFDLQASAPGWAYVGCRLVEMEDVGPSSVPSLEVVVYWDGTRELLVAGQPVTPAAPGVWILRLRPEPGRAVLSRVALAGAAGGTRGPSDAGAGAASSSSSTSSSTMTLDYRVPERFHHFALGMGLGPYSYQFYGQRGTNVSTITPEITLYASYFINESNRIVSFGAVAFHQTFYTDIGLYLHTVQARLFDNRLSVNLLLGAHVLGFRSLGEQYFRFGAPQGLELIFTDVFKRAHNLSAGAFIYPALGTGKQYYNGWLRWGSSSFFGEINYIAWQESIEEELIYSRSLGVAFGFPLARFF